VAAPAIPAQIRKIPETKAARGEPKEQKSIEIPVDREDSTILAQGIQTYSSGDVNYVAGPSRESHVHFDQGFGYHQPQLHPPPPSMLDFMQIVFGGLNER
jgi:hypothetical protein